MWRVIRVWRLGVTRHFCFVLPTIPLGFPLLTLCYILYIICIYMSTEKYAKFESNSYEVYNSLLEGGDKMTLQEDMGERIRRRRMALGWNQGQLAEETKMPQGHISRFEKGQYVAINPEKLVALAKVLGVTTDWLLGLTSELEGKPKHA